MDIARDNTASGLRSIRQFIQKCSHTNVLILNAHEGFDLLASSCVNKEVVHFTRKMSKLIRYFVYAQVVKVDLQREQFTAHGVHVNRQGKDATAQYLVSAIRNIFLNRHRDSSVILKWGEDQQDGDNNVLGLAGKMMFNGDSELIASKDQGKCYNNLDQNLGSGIIQNVRSDITQSVQSETVQSLDCRFSDLDNTLNKVTQLSIENSSMLASEHPSMEPSCSINRKRVKKLPKTRSDDFFMDIVYQFFGSSVKFNKPLILIHQNIRGLISKTDEIIVSLNVDKISPQFLCFLEHYMSEQFESC
jgi:hypothetical protein